MGGAGNPGDGGHKEAIAIAERYARRGDHSKYSMLRPEVLRSMQECQRGVVQFLAEITGRLALAMNEIRVLDVGCGYGGHILDFVRFGCLPANVSGIELLPERAEFARRRVPAESKVLGEDAVDSDAPDSHFHVVFQSVVFSSLLDDSYQQTIADRMWSWLAPGGAIIWYDLAFDNPKNRDVRGVPKSRVRELFHGQACKFRRITLAPPISRYVCRIHPALYGLFGSVSILRSHLLCMISKS